jgi:hypothetical protein
LCEIKEKLQYPAFVEEEVMSSQYKTVQRQEEEEEERNWYPFYRKRVDRNDELLVFSILSNSLKRYSPQNRPRQDECDIFEMIQFMETNREIRMN